MPYMIDEPSEFESLPVWVGFLNSILALDQSDPTVSEVVSRAKSIIASKEKNQNT